jgi:hypothetical protein
MTSSDTLLKRKLPNHGSSKTMQRMSHSTADCAQSVPVTRESSTPMVPIVSGCVITRFISVGLH